MINGTVALQVFRATLNVSTSIASVRQCRSHQKMASSSLELVDLPDDILLSIVSFCDGSCIVNLANTCKILHAAVEAEGGRGWRVAFSHHFGAAASYPLSSPDGKLSSMYGANSAEERLPFAQWESPIQEQGRFGDRSSNLNGPLGREGATLTPICGGDALLVVGGRYRDSIKEDMWWLDCNLLGKAGSMDWDIDAAELRVPTYADAAPESAEDEAEIRTDLLARATELLARRSPARTGATPLGTKRWEKLSPSGAAFLGVAHHTATSVLLSDASVARLRQLSVPPLSTDDDLALASLAGIASSASPPAYPTADPALGVGQRWIDPTSASTLGVPASSYGSAPPGWSEAVLVCGGSPADVLPHFNVWALLCSVRLEITALPDRGGAGKSSGGTAKRWRYHITRKLSCEVVKANLVRSTGDAPPPPPAGFAGYPMKLPRGISARILHAATFVPSQRALWVVGGMSYQMQALWNHESIDLDNWGICYYRADGVPRPSGGKRTATDDATAASCKYIVSPCTRTPKQRNVMRFCSRYGHTLTMVNGVAWLFGGACAEVELPLAEVTALLEAGGNVRDLTLRDLWCLDPSTRVWAKASFAPVTNADAMHMVADCAGAGAAYPDELKTPGLRVAQALDLAGYTLLPPRASGHAQGVKAIGPESSIGAWAAPSTRPSAAESPTGNGGRVPNWSASRPKAVAVGRKLFVLSASDRFFFIDTASARVHPPPAGSEATSPARLTGVCIQRPWVTNRDTPRAPPFFAENAIARIGRRVYVYGYQGAQVPVVPDLYALSTCPSHLDVLAVPAGPELLQVVHYDQLKETVRSQATGRVQWGWNRRQVAIRARLQAPLVSHKHLPRRIDREVAAVTPLLGRLGAPLRSIVQLISSDTAHQIAMADRQGTLNELGGWYSSQTGKDADGFPLEG